jgi:quercetin dioxygenase-like cupin family protein
METMFGNKKQESKFEPAFHNVVDLPRFSPVEGITMQAIIGEKMMANWVRLEPNAEMAEHEHPHEQVGYILEGALTLTMAGQTRMLTPGLAYIVPGGVRHRGIAGPDGCLVLDVFSPPREEYAALARGEG